MSSKGFDLEVLRVFGIATHTELSEVLAGLQRAVGGEPSARQFADKLPVFLAAMAERYAKLENEVAQRSHRQTASDDELLDFNEPSRIASTEAIQRSEEHFKEMMATLPGCAVRIDPNDDVSVEFATQGILALTGYSADDFASGSARLKDLIHTDDVSAVLSAVTDALMLRRSFAASFRIVRRDGEVQWVLSVGQGLFDEAGHLRCIEGFILDNNKVKAAEDEARHLRGILSRALNCVDAGFALYDASDVLVECNVAFKRLYPDLAPILVPGVPYLTILKALYASNVDGLGADALNEAEWIDELMRLRRLGKPTEAKINGRWILFHDRATPEGLVVSLRTDVTHFKELNIRLAQARDAAQAASKAKDEFLANVSHEIRTPMNGILGMADMVLATKLGPEQEQYVQMVKQSAHAMMVLIDNILDFSDIEAGLLALAPQSFSLRELISGCMDNFQSIAQRKGMGVQGTVDEDVADGVVADAPRLRQVLSNLLSNAVNYASAGQVAMNVSRCGPAVAGSHLVLFSVTDQGPSIPPEQASRVFSAFSQGDNSPTRKRGGLGLGLAIVKRIVEMMSGRIWYQAGPHGGNTFFVEIPLPQAAGVERNGRATANPGSISARRILIVEDNMINELVIVQQVKMSGHDFAVARNGEEAVTRCEGEKFDLVLMDIQMPVMDGLEATACIRARERVVGGYLPIVAVTANAMKVDRAKCLQAGMDGFLTKPIDRQRLSEEIARVLAMASGHETPRSPTGPPVDLDYAQLLQWLDGCRELTAHLVGSFIADAPVIIERITDSLREKDLARAMDCCMKLSGEAEKVSAQAMAMLARSTLDACRNGDADGAAMLSSRLLGALGRVREVVIAQHDLQA